MANPEHLRILKQSVEHWNEWRAKNPQIPIILAGADLSGMDLMGVDFNKALLPKANLSGTQLNEADLRGAELLGIDLSGANLRRAKLGGANLFGAKLVKADLQEATLSEADLHGAEMNEALMIGADLSGANLRRAKMHGVDLMGADLRWARLIETRLSRANLSNCRVYGISTWNLDTQGAIQSNLIITGHNEPVITVDNLELAQFVYLLIHNQKLRDVIDTIGKKTVLILGRFAPPERKEVLDTLREELRKQNYIPILFDFDKPESRNFTETIVTLAHLSRFVIADLTDPRSIPQELQAIAPNARSVPIQPIILSGHRPYAMFADLRDFHWVLDLVEYATKDQLVSMLHEKVIEPAEAKADELRARFLVR